LQHIAEEEIGKRVREAQSDEDAIALRNAEIVNGSR
jgi:hypothetical protein